MLKRVSTRLGLILLTADLALTALALHLAKLLRLALPFGIYLKEPLSFGPWFYVLVPTVWALTFFALRVYDPARGLRYLNDAQALWSAVTWASLAFAGVAYLFFREFSRLLFAYFYVLDLALLLGWRALFQRLLRLGWGRSLVEPRRVLVVGTGALGRALGEAVRNYQWMGMTLVGFVDDTLGESAETDVDCPVLGTFKDIGAIATRQGVDEIILASSIHTHERAQQIISELQALPVSVRVVPDVLDLALIQASAEEFAGIPLIGLREPVIEGPDRVVKRLFDLVVGSAAMVILSPLMLLAAAAVRIDSPGPVFFLQERIGEGGRPFQIFKFRTMHIGAEADEQRLAEKKAEERVPEFVKQPDDPRITHVGHMLRRFSIDELPQLINVLKGDMSLVGPRPELPWLVEQYDLWERKRLTVPQGMTGWWQVNGRSNRASYDLRVEDDLYYIRNWSIWLDARILWMTVGAVLRGEGAY